jgi:hypothetical protein
MMCGIGHGSFKPQNQEPSDTRPRGERGDPWLARDLGVTDVELRSEAGEVIVDVGVRARSEL